MIGIWEMVPDDKCIALQAWPIIFQCLAFSNHFVRGSTKMYWFTLWQQERIWSLGGKTRGEIQQGCRPWTKAWERNLSWFYTQKKQIDPQERENFFICMGRISSRKRNVFTGMLVVETERSSKGETWKEMFISWKQRENHRKTFTREHGQQVELRPRSYEAEKWQRGHGSKWSEMSVGIFVIPFSRTLTFI